jgi:hypothetical protein
MKTHRLYLAIFFITIAAIAAGCGEDTTSPVTPQTGNQAPNSPSNPTPSDGATISAGSSVTLRWSCSDPNASDTVRYNILFGTSNPPTTILASGIPDKIYDLGIPGPGTYYWKIVATDNGGLSTSGAVWQFIVQ